MLKNMAQIVHIHPKDSHAGKTIVFTHILKSRDFLLIGFIASIKFEAINIIYSVHCTKEITITLFPVQGNDRYFISRRTQLFFHPRKINVIKKIIGKAQISRSNPDFISPIGKFIPFLHNYQIRIP